MKISVVNPPFKNGRFSRTSRSPAIVKSGTMYWPFWLAYLVGGLERAGHTVQFLDCPARGIRREDLSRVVGEFGPDLVVMDTSTPSINSDLAVAEELIKGLPGSRLVLVGTHVSALPLEVLARAPFVDAVAVGEYDISLVRAASGEDLLKIPGIGVNTPDGGFLTGPPELVKDLDSLPFLADVYRRHLRPEDYFFAAARYPSVMTITSRGCPYKCSFCVWPQVLHPGGYRARSAGNVATEFRLIAEYFPQVREIVVEDDTFSVDSSRVSQVASAIAAAGNRLPWTANTRANLSLEAMRTMKAAGCRMLIVGYESGSQEILNGVSKGTTVQQNLDFSARARKAGLMVHGCFMVGNPGETRKTMEQTLSMAMKLRPDTAQFFPIMAYPGTRLYEQYRHEGKLRTTDYTQWLTSDGLHNCVVDLPGLPAEDLVSFCNHARKKFYLRPSYIAAKVVQSVLHPLTEGRRNLKAFGTFRRHLFRGSR
jgi:radical SAM superfamily enzyme YgiQ (UPF0313 family)